MKFLLPLLIFVSAPLLPADVLPPPPKLPPQARKVTVEEAEKILKEHPDTGILDVRTVDEVVERGRIPGSKHLDFMREDFALQLGKTGVDPAKPCILYCALGGRAERAAGVLARAGFREILLPIGGFNAWKKAGKPVEGGREPAK